MIKADIQNLIDTEVSILEAKKAVKIPPEPIQEREKVKSENNDQEDYAALSI